MTIHARPEDIIWEDPELSRRDELGRIPAELRERRREERLAEVEQAIDPIEAFKRCFGGEPAVTVQRGYALPPDKDIQDVLDEDHALLRSEWELPAFRRMAQRRVSKQEYEMLATQGDAPAGMEQRIGRIEL